MKLFQRIFATFCAVIVCAIFVASFSFWLVQNTLAENQFNQRRTIETTLMSSIVSAFNSRGDSGAREILSEWKNNPVSNAVYVITGDDKKDILGRDIDSLSIERARIFAINNPESDLAHIESTVSAKNTFSSLKAGTTIRPSACLARSSFPACRFRLFGTNLLSCLSSSSSAC